MKPKILFIISLAGALETFDFFLYAAFFNVIVSTFFPTDHKLLSLFMSITGFGISFLMRPIGALIFGYLGDTVGRKPSLSFSLIFMAFPTLIIGILPSYAEIGIAASFLIVFARLAQGIFYGGNLNGTFIYALEHTHKNSGLISGVIISSCVFGLFLTTVLNHLTHLPGLPNWAWRIPFLGGSCIGFIGYFLHKHMIESNEFLRRPPSKSRFPVLTLLQKRTLSCCLCFSIGALIGGLFYVDFSFLNLYLSHYYPFSLSDARKMNVIFLVAFICSSPFFGILYDKMSLKMNSFSFLRIMSYCLFFGLIPIFWLITSDLPFVFLLGIISLGICTASISTVGFSFMQSLFPIGERYSGISLFYTLGVTLSAGIAPIFYMEAIQIHKESLFFPAYCLMCLVALFYGSLKIYTMKHPLPNFEKQETEVPFNQIKEFSA